MKDLLAELRKDIEIDPAGLDVEAVRQADLFFKWGELYAKAKAKFDAAQADLEILECKMQMSARTNPDHFGIEKITEAGIQAAVRGHSRFAEAHANMQKLRYRADLLRHAVASMEQKKRMIEVLITLHGQEYFAGPSVPRNLVSEWAQHQKRVGERVLAREVSKARRVRK